MVDTLKRNQNIPDTGPLIAGTTKIPATNISRAAAPTSTFCCIGSRSFFTRVRVSRPDDKNRITGNPTLKAKPSHFTLGKGRSQPPQKSVTATEATTKILAYSARKYRAQRKPLYSVWNPATSSDS